MLRPVLAGHPDPAPASAPSRTTRTDGRAASRILWLTRFIRGRLRGGYGWFDVVVDTGRGQEPVRAAFVDAESRLGRQLAAAPADAVVFQGAAHAVVGDGAMLQVDTAARAEAPSEKRAKLSGTAVGVVRAKGPAEVPVRREGAHDRFGVTSGQRGLVAADHIAGVGLPGLEDGRPDMTPLVDRPLAAAGATGSARPAARGLAARQLHRADESLETTASHTSCSLTGAGECLQAAALCPPATSSSQRRANESPTGTEAGPRGITRSGPRTAVP